MPIILRLPARPLHLGRRRGEHLRQLPRRNLALQAPAPVIARMLGYTDQQTSRIATAVGSPWSRYAPGDDHSP
ncbi:hypothetical protein [Actinoallomurus sp. NPDC050550]|uniref:hypothetical protein n=1 Tax=Actinoallomurus sp. NPDC050550 TaxID=3154937 RepID=UPI0033D09AAA